MSFAVGSLVRARGREWVVLPESKDDLLIVRPIGGASDETTGIFLPLETVDAATFQLPDPAQVGDYQSCRLLRDALRLGFRSSAGPFRSFASIAVDPRPYQLVPLLMALKLDPVRLLIADDVGIGKTIEAGLIAKELLERGEAERLAVLCPPHLAEQWQKELAEKFHIEAELVLPSTVRRLERPCRPGESLFEYYPFVIVSIEFIKSDRRRDEFVRTCPDLVIIDEAHTCACADEGPTTRKQRFELASAVAADSSRHLILVTATPHSGKEEEFRSLLGLLDRSLANLPDDLSGPENLHHRQRLANHFIQRRRADIRAYLDSETPFPDRECGETSYKLTPEYAEFLRKVVKYARQRVAGATGTQYHQRVRWWSALALLRSIASSPRAAAATLRSRAACADAETEEEVNAIGRRTVMDILQEDLIESIDTVPGSEVAQESEGDDGDRRRLRELAREAERLEGDSDAKVHKAARLIAEIVDDGYNPIVFCRFIPTAEYVAEVLRNELPDKVEVAAVTGTLPPEEREARVLELGKAPHRVLVCTDCLSEGINLQEIFDAVFHYDLAWNPTRHEQREGRVDRFGQPRPNVRVVTYYGVDNQIDGLVLKVLLKKHRTIRNSLGISVPVPAKAEEVMEAIFEHLLLREDWGHDANAQLSLFDELFDSHAKDFELEWESAAEREKRSRTRFAQETIKPEKVAAELRAMQDAIGSGVDLEWFVRNALSGYGAVVRPNNGCLTLDLSACPTALKEMLGTSDEVKVRFEMPVKPGEIYLTRTHPFTEALASYVLEEALDARDQAKAARCGAIRTRAVQKRTTLLLVRFRYHIITQTGDSERPLLAEDCRLLAFEGSPENANWLPDERAKELLGASPDANIAPEAARDFVGKVVQGFNHLSPHLETVARQQAAELLEAHRRVRTVSQHRGVRHRVEPNLPPDVLGIYVCLPAEVPN